MSDVPSGLERALRYDGTELASRPSMRDTKEPEHVLDPAERVSEVVYGVIMATAVTGSVSVASGDVKSGRTMLFAALGCNLAWGVTDAAMFLVNIAMDRHRRAAWLRAVQGTQNTEAAHRLIADALPRELSGHITTPVLESMRQQLLTVTVPPSELRLRDYLGAVSVLALMVLATLPVVIPFMLVGNTTAAHRTANGLAIATLFIGGAILGRYSRGRPWRDGLALAALGAALVAIIIALGG